MKAAAAMGSLDEGVEGLLSEVEAFLKRWNMLPSQFGQAVAGNDRIVFRLRQGHGISLTNAIRMRSFMAGYALDRRKPAPKSKAKKAKGTAQ